jgi:nucleoside-diphosphate-sugar epimerase
LTLEAANDVITTAVIRPGFVYGGTKSLIANYAESARATDAAVYIGDSKNRMPFVHCDDLAVLYRLVIEKRAQGIFHGVDGASPSLASVARAVTPRWAKVVRPAACRSRRPAPRWASPRTRSAQLVVTKRSAELGWRATHPTLDTDSGVEAAVAEWKREVGA